VKLLKERNENKPKTKEENKNNQNKKISNFANPTAIFPQIQCPTMIATQWTKYFIKISSQIQLQSRISHSAIDQQNDLSNDLLPNLLELSFEITTDDLTARYHNSTKLAYNFKVSSGHFYFYFICTTRATMETNNFDRLSHHTPVSKPSAVTFRISPSGFKS